MGIGLPFCLIAAAQLLIMPIVIAQAPAQTPANTQTDAPTGAQVLTLYREGKKDQAAEAAQTVLKSTPNDLSSLYIGARVYQDKGQLDDAIRLIEALNHHHPGLPIGWEIATQVYQAADRLPQRDAALRQLMATQAASLDRATRQRGYVVRDRISAYGHVVLVQDHADTGGPDMMRYVFLPESAPRSPTTYLAVLTDSVTTGTWRDNGMLPAGKRLFHLDSIYVAPDGGHGQAMYAVWPDPPDYDTVRAKVLQVMAGAAKPLSGQAGGLAIPAKPAN